MNRKGVTPVIATVLLIGIAVMATAGAYTTIQTVQESAAEQIQSDLDREAKEQQTEFNIEQVYNGTHGHMIINLRNTGSRSLEIFRNGDKTISLYIDGPPQDYEFTGSQPEFIEPDEMIEINTTEKFPEQSEQKYLTMSGPFDSSDSHTCFFSERGSC